MREVELSIMSVLQALFFFFTNKVNFFPFFISVDRNQELATWRI